MRTDRNIAALMVILSIAMIAGLAAPAAADGVALGEDGMNVIDESNTPAGGTAVEIAHSMRIAQTQHFQVLPEDVYPYDLYLWTQTMSVEGTLEGDAYVGCQSMSIDGVVTGDVGFLGNTLTVDGEIGDDLRGAGETFRIDGTVRGDVLVAGANLIITESGVIEGSLLVGAGTVTNHGHVMGSARIGAGTVNMTGRIDGNAEIFTDGGLTLSDDARIGGDLVYQGPARQEFGPENVAGSVTYMEPKEDVSTSFDFSPGFMLALHIFEFIMAIIAGLVIIALTKRHARKTANVIRTRPLKSLGIGFVAYLCLFILTPICILSIIMFPLGIVFGAVLLIAVIVAKFYVAIWLGNWILRRGDRIMTTSPIPTMLLGLVPIYIVTAIPVLGTLIGIVIIFFGLGALLQRKEVGLDKAFEPVETADDDALPSVFPGTTEG